ncbi:MAG: ExbD/TolR family protein [Akkermansiaceae bacterium]
MNKRIQRKKKQKRRAIPVPIASMGDIAFLLIIFFLVCSESVKDNANIEATVPQSEYAKKMEASVAARVAIDVNGVIYFDGTPVDNAKDIEWGVRAILANTASDDQRHVQFKCDAALPKETFEPVMKAIVEAGGILEAVGENNQE